MEGNFICFILSCSSKGTIYCQSISRFNHQLFHCLMCNSYQHKVFVPAILMPPRSYMPYSCGLVRACHARRPCSCLYVCAVSWEINV